MLQYAIALCLLVAAGVSADNYAVLVAGSRGWENYRHQADTCHAYQILHKHGIPDENIVVFMYDDIANNIENPYKGQLFNEPDGPNVYVGVPKDYNGAHVNPTTFEAVMLGKPTGVGSHKTLKSGENDNVFVYFVDHGAPDLLAFPSQMYHMKQLEALLRNMHATKMYKNLVFYLEACESGSMFEWLPDNLGIYAVSASNDHESSWGCYCRNNKHLPCLGDLFSVSWMQDSDKENINTETLEHQYEVTLKNTTRSHVEKFGDPNIMHMLVVDFLGKKAAERLVPVGGSVKRPITDTVDARDVPLHQLRVGLEQATLPAVRHAKFTQLLQLAKGQQFVDRLFESLLVDMFDSAEIAQRFMTSRPEALDHECNELVYRTFDTHCLNVAENAYAMKHMHVLAAVCAQSGQTKEWIALKIANSCQAKKTDASTKWPQSHVV